MLVGFKKIRWVKWLEYSERRFLDELRKERFRGKDGRVVWRWFEILKVCFFWFLG